ncbi:unnamed protein product [Polarella glacialis]|uniref:Uncharacterized protein n=1 Tax=Polarella glacialis TaxID=89957 RepID=A0A813JLL0_POLGL|nr:unnamed protein product [Polarella glacialis]
MQMQQMQMQQMQMQQMQQGCHESRPDMHDGQFSQGYDEQGPSGMGEEAPKNHALQALTEALDRAEVDMLMGARRRAPADIRLDACGGLEDCAGFEDLLSNGAGGGSGHTNYALQAASAALGAADPDKPRRAPASKDSELDLSMARALGLARAMGPSTSTGTRSSGALAAVAGSDGASRARRGPPPKLVEDPLELLPGSGDGVALTGTTSSSRRGRAHPEFDGPVLRPNAANILGSSASSASGRSRRAKDPSGDALASLLDDVGFAPSLGHVASVSSSSPTPEPESKEWAQREQEVHSQLHDFRPHQPQGSSDATSSRFGGNQSASPSQASLWKPALDDLGLPGLPGLQELGGPGGRPLHANHGCNSGACSTSHCGSSRGNLLFDDDDDEELELMARREMEEEFAADLNSQPPVRPRTEQCMSGQLVAPASSPPLQPPTMVPPSASQPGLALRPPSGRNTGPCFVSASPGLPSSRGVSPNLAFWGTPEPGQGPPRIAARSSSRSRVALIAAHAEAKEQLRHNRRDHLVDFILNDGAAPPRRSGTPRTGTPRKQQDASRSGSRRPSSASRRGGGISLYQDPPEKNPATPRKCLPGTNKAGLRPMSFFDEQAAPPALPQLTPRSAGPGGRPPDQRSQKSLTSASGSQSARAWRTRASANMMGLI